MFYMGPRRPVYTIGGKNYFYDHHAFGFRFALKLCSETQCANFLQFVQLLFYLCASMWSLSAALPITRRFHRRMVWNIVGALVCPGVPGLPVVCSSCFLSPFWGACKLKVWTESFGVFVGCFYQEGFLAQSRFVLRAVQNILSTISDVVRVFCAVWANIVALVRFFDPQGFQPCHEGTCYNRSSYISCEINLWCSPSSLLFSAEMIDDSEV